MKKRLFSLIFFVIVYAIVFLAYYFIFDDMLKLCEEYNTECEKLHDKLYKECKLIINNL